MKKLSGLILLLFGFTGTLFAQTALEIITQADQKHRGETKLGEMSMTIQRPGWERTIKMKTWSKGSEYFRIYVS